MKIPEKKRQTYKKTFLKHVQALFSFPAIENFAERLNAVKSFLLDHQYVMETVSGPEVLSAHADALTITLQNGLLTIRMDAANYRGFEYYTEKCEVLLDLLVHLKVMTLELVVLQKMNMYVFSKERFPNGLTADEVEHRLYSEDFLAQGPSCTAGDYNEISVLAQRKFVEQEKKYLDTLTITTIMQRAVPMNESLACLEKENQMIYNMFHWATSDWLREVMDKK